jgi:hypothetical protein
MIVNKNKFPFEKLFFSLPILLYAVFTYGKIIENGDENAAGMYVIVFFIPTVFFAVLSYLTYYFTAKRFKIRQWDFLKNISHFIWFFLPFIFWTNWKFLIWTLILIIGIINTIHWLYLNRENIYNSED